MMDREHVRLNRRCAGNVIRYHTWPTHIKQTIADHTFHVLRIYYELWPEDFQDPTIRLMHYILYHDFAEIATGDIPYPVKMQNPELKIIMNKLEYQQLYDMNIDNIELPEIQKTRVKLCDLAEMYEFAHHERKLGNSMAEPICGRVFATIQTMAFADLNNYQEIMDYLHKVKT